MKINLLSHERNLDSLKLSFKLLYQSDYINGSINKSIQLQLDGIMYQLQRLQKLYGETIEVI